MLSLQFKIEWACDLKIETDQKMIDLVKRFHIPKTTTDYRQVLADPAVKAVIITTTTDMHTEVFLTFYEHRSCYSNEL